jgi:hypothetical protein
LAKPKLENFNEKLGFQGGVSKFQVGGKVQSGNFKVQSFFLSDFQWITIRKTFDLFVLTFAFST